MIFLLKIKFKYKKKYKFICILYSLTFKYTIIIDYNENIYKIIKHV